MDSYSARKLIERCFPDLRIKHSKRIVTGWENFVLEVNKEYVFRFPKFRETENRLRNEIEFLPILANRLSTPVPDYEFVWKGDRKYPHRFGGYRKINGVTVESRRYRNEWTRPLATQISGFLKELHSIRVRENSLKDVPRYSREEWLKSIGLQHNKIRRITYPLLDSKLRARSEEFWRALLADFAYASFRPTLIHGDLSTENILIDPATVRLTGILDWGYMQVSDPALEFAHLFMHESELGEEVLKLYGAQGSDLKKRVQWYVDSEPFYDIMWGVSHHWQKAKRLGLTRLAKTLRARTKK
ncbi:aminoglycoside phosphotransferase family protein [Candidatus Bathyarchaeota archaeon]|nr:MAG: hypothetical protein AUI07_05690 [archaeon 13_2_20CM_2_53_6]TMI25299.1 MAG: aminoglycoside phosphotransferase family protein [Candidatus Bathyarchaeota archaeon]